MNKFKRFLSLFLVLVMILSLMPVSAYAEAEEEEPAAVEETVVEESEHEQENSALVSDVQDDPLPEEPVSLEETVAGESEQEQEIPEEQPEAESAAFKMLTSTAPGPIASGKCGDSITWELYEGDALVIEGSGPMWDTRLGDSYPRTVKTVTIGSGVTSVGSSAFFGFDSLESVSLPDTVTSIGDQAFRNCSLLTSITFPSGLKSIGQFAFDGCVALSGDIVLPEGLISIGSCAFYDCWSLTGIMLPASLTSIEPPLAAGRSSALTKINVSESSLTYSSIGGVLYSKDGKTLVCCPGAVSGSFTVPENVTDIAECAFYGCSGLTDITIPKSVTSIKIKAFNGCTSLKDVQYGGSSTDWAQIAVGNDNDPLLNADFLFAYGSCGDNLTWALDDNGVLTISGSGAMTDYDMPDVKAPWDSQKGSITSVKIASGVTSIGNNAFYGCENLSSVEIPASVASIGEFAFCDCSSIEVLMLPYTVGTIGDYAFYGCKSLVFFTVPSGVTKLSRGLFYNCTNLTSVIIPAGVTKIGERPFAGCTALTDINFRGLESDWSSIAFDENAEMPDVQMHFNYTEAHGESIAYGTDSGIVWILYDDGTLAVSGNGNIPNYSNSSAIPWKDLRSSVLTVEIAENITGIGENAFSGCTALTSVSIPSTVGFIGEYAFWNCPALASITVAQGNITFISSGNCLIDKSSGSLVLGCKNSVIPADGSVTSIGAYAFTLCSGLTSVTIPGSVTAIGKGAFDGCEALKDVYFYGSQADWAAVTVADDNEALTGADIHCIDAVYGEITDSGECGDNITWTLYDIGLLTITGSGAMDDFPGNRPWSDYAEDITSVVLPEGLTTIGAYAFSDFTALEEIILPNGLKEIGDYAFSFCENLTDICLPASLESLGENAFFFCSALTAITVPSKITSIPTSAFEYCTSLASAVLPEGLKEIGENAFFCCALTGLDLPEGLEVIGENALGGNPFTTIELPDSTQAIGPWAFQGSGLTSITLPDGIETIEQGTFAACQSLTSVTISGSVVKIGENAFNSCSNLAAVTFVGTEDEKNQMTVESGNDPLLNAEWTITLAGRGTCGTSLSWTLDNNGVLTISGSGAMDDYTSLDPAPWESFNDSITSVIIKDGVTYIGARAFYVKDEEDQQYANLSSVSIGPDVTAIGDYAFYHCKALTSAAMPDNLTEIGSGAFMGCAFESIDLPDGLETIGNAAFAQCENLISITILGSVTLIEEQAFAECSSLISVVFEEGITDIPNYCFAGDTALAEVSLPASLTAIGESVFDECGSLKTVRYAGEAEDWENVSVGDGNDVLETAKVLCAGSDFTVEYVLNGGTNSSLNPETYNILDDAVTLTDPTRTGYTFGGWYTDSGFTTRITVIQPDMAADLTLHAKWIENKYSIVFKPNGGTGSMSAMSGRSYSGSYTLTSNAFSRKYYTFTGWNTKADGSGTKYANKASVSKLSAKNGETVTLYAQWSLTKYTITYNLNGGKNNSGNPAAYTVQSEAIKLKNPTRTGYTFKGWYTDKSCKKAVSKTAIAKGSSGNKTFYAKWQVNKYSITYKANGGKGSMAAKKNISYSTSFTLAKNKFTRKGYSFAGWNTKADGSGTAYKNKASVSKLSSKSGGKVTLYAQWKVKTYTITYKANGGKNNTSNPTTYTVKKAVSLKSPKRTGYTFKGWYSNKGLTKKSSSISKGSTGNKTVYAKWEAVKYKITYNLNGGKNNTANPKTYTIANTVTLKSPKRTGYTFAGWYSDSAFTVRVTSIPKGSTGAITLYAKWIKK